jgi:hypothetical protein
MFALSFAQSPPQKPETQQGMGVETGPARTYSSRRTVGITDPKAPVVFEDVTARTAIAKFLHHSGTPQKDYIFDTPSGGVAVFDYDGDGRGNGRTGETTTSGALSQFGQLEV